MSWLAIRLIGLYKRWISPALPLSCRFVPTCSEYAMEAIDRHGMLLGAILALRRLLHCHPLGGSGYDPVPRNLRFKISDFRLRRHTDHRLGDAASFNLKS
jgi:putative membrane protein insertion efficiency factor